MIAHRDALDLLYAWDVQAAQGDTPTSVPFCEKVHDLVAQGRLDDALNDLAEISPHPLNEEGLDSLLQMAHALAMETMIGDPDDPHAPFALLVALPLFGVVSQLSLAEDFWTTVNAQMQERVQAHLGRAAVQFELKPIGPALRPEGLATLTVDGLRQLTEELGRGQPGQQVNTLMDFEAAADQQMDPVLTSASIQLVGQRMAVATVVFDPDEWPRDESVAEWLNQMATDDTWVEQFFTTDRIVMPPMAVPEAMTEALSTRLRLMVDIGLDDRDLHPRMNTAELSWSLSQDDDNETVTLQPQMNGVPLDPVPLPGRWVVLVGADGLHEACQAWVTGQSLTTEPQDETPEPIELVAPRRRLH